MSKSPLPIAIFARDSSDRVQAELEQVLEVVQSRRGLEIVALLREPGAVPSTDVEPQLALVMGGDGSILRACRDLGHRQTPIIGINLGRLGFLADLSPQEFRDNVHLLEQRRYRVVEHLMFCCEVHRADGGVERYLGLNETAVLSGASLQMVDVALEIGGEFVTTFSGDGLIISTPVGSTAHSLSAGGPILRQDLQAFVVTPVCPHTLTARSVVDDADVDYVLSFPRHREGMTLVIDGQIKRALDPGDRVLVRKAEVSFQLARFPGHSFYGTLHQKLGWTGQPLYQR